MNIPPTKPYFPKEDIQQIKGDVENILESGRLTLGEYTKRFEAGWAGLCGVKHAVAVSSGTAALEIALRVLGIGKGDEVLVPTNTFTATASTVYCTRAKPVLTDINFYSLTLDLANIAINMTVRTKAVIIVHVGGFISPTINLIRKMCDEENLFLIEDAAHAQGSTLRGQSSGSFGEVGCFSFYPTKVITTGEGGMLTTDNDEVAEKARILRDQGKQAFNSNKIVELGYNWRLPEINAAIGIAQLKRLPEIIEKRNKIAKYYDGRLQELEGIYPLTPRQETNNYYKYIAFLMHNINREKVKQKLREKGVCCGGEVYWPPLHLQPLYQRLLGTKQGDFPVAEDLCSRMLCLPIYSQMTVEEAEYVTQQLEDVLA